MRHGKKFNHLGRQKGHREAMLSNMAVSLIMHKKINTTVAKAKALRKFVEPIITKAKEDSTHSRRLAFSYLQSKDAIKELFSEVAVKVADRPGGYTRILKTGFRAGDAAEMCFIELVDFNENMLASEPKKKTRRRSKKKSTSESEEVAAPAAKASKTTEPEAPAIEDVEAVAVAEEVVAEAKAPEASTGEEAEDTAGDEKKEEGDKA